jgi:multidrug efflux pump subunit AcrA (membrane-fusion protein)
MYAEVKFTLPRSHPVVLIPGSALIANAEGTKVARIQADKRVRLVVVQSGRDLGTQVEILSGLGGSEEVVNNPPDTLFDGQQVNVVQAPQEGKR